jgi:hypothetical protein
MNRATAIALLLLVVVGVLGSVYALKERASAQPRMFTVHVPNVSRNVAPTPVPTVGSADREVLLEIHMDANELSLEEAGVVAVTIDADATARLPGRFDPPVTATGHVTVFLPHPVDSVGCTWTRVFANPEFKMTISQPGGADLSLLVNLSGPEWHYDVVCPTADGGEIQVRVPKFGEESITGFLGLMFPGRGGPGGVVIQTPVYTGVPACVRRMAVEQGMHPIFGSATVTVWVYEPPCLVPV